MQFAIAPYLGVDSLLLKVKLDLRNATLKEPVQLAVTLTYADGAERTHTLSSNSDSLELTVKAECDFDKHVVKQARGAIILPAGSGSVQIQSMSMFRDPLLRDPG